MILRFENFCNAIQFYFLVAEIPSNLFSQHPLNPLQNPLPNLPQHPLNPLQNPLPNLPF